MSAARSSSNLATQNTGLSNLSSPSPCARPVHGHVTRKWIAERNERQAQEFSRTSMSDKDHCEPFSTEPQLKSAGWVCALQHHSTKKSFTCAPHHQNGHQYTRGTKKVTTPTPSSKKSTVPAQAGSILEHYFAETHANRPDFKPGTAAAEKAPDRALEVRDGFLPVAKVLQKSH